MKNEKIKPNTILIAFAFFVLMMFVVLILCPMYPGYYVETICFRIIPEINLGGLGISGFNFHFYGFSTCFEFYEITLVIFGKNFIIPTKTITTTIKNISTTKFLLPLFTISTITSIILNWKNIKNEKTENKI